MEKDILIAGGTGLVGANLTLKLKQMGLSVVSTKFQNKDPLLFTDFMYYDFRCFEDCFEATKHKGAVVLCAAISYGAKENKDNPTGSIYPNLQISAGLLEACAKNKVGTVIIMSSTTVYQPALFAIREDQLNLNMRPFDLYYGVGWFNRYLEQLASLYAKTYGMRIIIFRPTSIYGPFDKFDDERSHVVPSLIKRALNKENPFEVWGNPHVVRDFIYVEDVVDDIVFALMNETIPSCEPINLCNGVRLTIEEATDIILKVCGHSPKIFFNSSKPSASPYRVVDDTKHHCFFGKRSRTPFNIGIKKSVDWYKTTG